MYAKKHNLWQTDATYVFKNVCWKKLTSTMKMERMVRLMPWRTRAGFTPCDSSSGGNNTFSGTSE